MSLYRPCISPQHTSDTQLYPTQCGARFAFQEAITLSVSPPFFFSLSFLFAFLHSTIPCSRHCEVNRGSNETWLHCGCMRARCCASVTSPCGKILSSTHCSLLHFPPFPLDTHTHTALDACWQPTVYKEVQSKTLQRPEWSGDTVSWPRL